MLVIYGATGYTGQLIVAEALAHGLRPVLAGRNPDRLRAMSEPLGLAWRASPIDDPRGLDRALEGATVVLHAAGPFVHTWRPMLDACIRHRAHYLDITGEIPVFEGIAKRDAELRDAGIMALPGAGFDVVPTDCLGAHLSRRLPDATHLALAFHAGGGVSHGTLLTVLEGMGHPGAIRRDGAIVPVPQAWRTRRIDFGDGRPRDATTIPWGDVSTAYHSTGIPNVEVYMTMPARLRRTLIATRWLGPVLRSRLVRGPMKALLDRRVTGPSAAARERSANLVWGEASDANGKRAVATLRAPDAYTLTARTSVSLARKILDGDVRVGFHTPSGAYGPDFVLGIPGVVRRDAS
jgi:short subunit dehydrogenase-like uncharacterized protein